MKGSFHLSIGVRSVEESEAFFVDVMRGAVVHRDRSGYVNIDFYGCQITLTPAPEIAPDLHGFHFGVNLGMAEFDELAEAILRSGYRGVVMPPKVVDAHTPLERKKMYLRCPSGYLIELKGYR